MRYVRWISIMLILIGLAGLGILCLGAGATEITARLVPVYCFAAITLAGFAGMIIWALWRLAQEQRQTK